MKGELYFPDEGRSLLFLIMVENGPARKTPEESGSDTVSCLRVGFIGDQDNKDVFKEFAGAVSKALRAQGVDCEWTPDVLENKVFEQFVKDDRDHNYRLATAVQEKELRAAKVLENASVRDVAMMVRRSGVILAKELLKQKAGACR